MERKAFDALVEERIKKIRSVLEGKGKEYATDEDSLHNFKRAAELLDSTPEEALLGMLAKHLVSVIDIVKDRTYLPPVLHTSPQVAFDMIDEKIGDSINYL